MCTSPATFRHLYERGKTLGLMAPRPAEDAAWYTAPMMRHSRVVILAAGLLAGCADRSAADEGGSSNDDGSTTEATASMASESTNGSSTASPSTSGSAEDTTSPTSGSTSAGGESSGDSTTSPDSTDSTSTASDRGEGPDTDGDGAIYTARAIIGGLDRIEVRRQDPNADTCMWLRLVHPHVGGDYSVTTPMSWSVEQIAINDVAISCTAENPSMFGAEGATGATGLVTFGMVGPSGFPCEIDLDIEAEFNGFLPNIPPVASMAVSNLPVTDACP